MVDSHVCFLQQRFDLSSKAKLWAMPRKEICLCQGVVAPKMITSHSCHTRGNKDVIQDLWSTEDPSLITLLTSRRNWTPGKLDSLLRRSDCCKF